MPVRLGDDAPNFTAETTEGTVTLYDYLGDGWGLLFSHPKDFTPVCTTELGAFAKRKGEFDQRGVKIIGVSVDPLESHKQLGRRHRGDAGRRAELPAHRRPRPQGRRPLRHDPPERQRHPDRALGVRDRPRQEGQADHHLPGEHRAQHRRDPAGDRLAPAHRQLPGGHPGQLEGRRRRDHRRRGQRRGRQGPSSRRAGTRRSPTCGSRPSRTSSEDGARGSRSGRPGCRSPAPRSAGGTRSTCRWSPRSRSPGPG